MTRPELLVIAAVARNGAIGQGSGLLWQDRTDQKHFRDTTMGCPVIMGRKTWDSLPDRFRPLPGRRNIVVTRDPRWHAEGAEPAASLDAALAAVQSVARAFVIGGAQLYHLALPIADTLVLTEIDADFDADAFFPALDNTRFERHAGPDHVDALGRTFRFVTYNRKKEI
jgi:dihydrofolate reductase